MTELNLVTIEHAIRDALHAIRPGNADLGGDADLMQEADLDSIGVMDLVMEIEDRLDLSIPVETLAQTRTINGLRAGISQLSGGGAA
ncbi:acyl carrier protein [Ramlibacter sp. H39-3-26]|uniref:acyl carrier protein n=1 Tax=Curvibacter soli TaxID=3031331 RepID=UPI0023D9E78C|nr:acyl carrier protein [Ramlibacter sp. H39-3-26]MDF1485073.1 acyl carrier protein [Ramlibacter sp. H39-3-26]